MQVGAYILIQEEIEIENRSVFYGGHTTSTGQETGHLLGIVPSKHLRHGTTSPLSSAQSQLTTNQENGVNTI